MASLVMQSVGLAIISCIFYLTLRSYTIRRRKSLPPGPSGLPFLGNSLDIPKSQEWLAFIEMSRKYDSDIISLNLAGDIVIVLNSLRAVDALLEDKSAIYSDRPPFTMLNDLVGYHWNLGFMRYGPRWKEHRKVLLQQFQPSAVLLHRPVELEAARVLLQRLLESPAKYERHFRHMAGMVILSTAYGINVQPEDDPYVDISEKAMVGLAATVNRGSYLVDSLPFLKYVPDFFPGAGFKKQAREWFKVVDAMPNVPFEFVKKARVSTYGDGVADGIARPSIASRVLDQIEEDPGDDPEDQKLVLRNILGLVTGADTTVSSLGSFILAMTLYPDVQKKAQAAVDAVVGHDRLPDFQDNIPYLDAVVREVLRWRPVLPLDDIYKGFHIPAGAVVLGNTCRRYQGKYGRAIFHDEATYGPRTELFIPERWLTKDGELNINMRDSTSAFGFGRRICPVRCLLSSVAELTPGRDMAQWSIWICAASILAAFDIRKSVDENGVPIEPSEEYTSGAVWWVLTS
ncbi:Cytochrome p450 [Mycena venus]|uniref:Cytochrome p450 n=1 Tax=Mycena venus TaxID=2733690 RepID=A0A8H6X8V4_9AGAR|nr:Cytochrome p450 [Mycena venus]